MQRERNIVHLDYRPDGLVMVVPSGACGILGLKTSAAKEFRPSLGGGTRGPRTHL